jgi:hypothetical protein
VRPPAVTDETSPAHLPAPNPNYTT